MVDDFGDNKLAILREALVLIGALCPHTMKSAMHAIIWGAVVTSLMAWGEAEGEVAIRAMLFAKTAATAQAPCFARQAMATKRAPTHRACFGRGTVGGSGTRAATAAHTDKANIAPRYGGMAL